MQWGKWVTQSIFFTQSAWANVSLCALYFRERAINSVIQYNDCEFHPLHPSLSPCLPLSHGHFLNGVCRYQIVLNYPNHFLVFASHKVS